MDGQGNTVSDRFLLFFFNRMNEKARRLKNFCSLNIKAMILKTVLSYYSRSVQLGTAIYPALIANCFPFK